MKLEYRNAKQLDKALKRIEAEVKEIKDNYKIIRQDRLSIQVDIKEAITKIDDLIARQT